MEIGSLKNMEVLEKIIILLDIKYNINFIMFKIINKYYEN